VYLEVFCGDGGDFMRLLGRLAFWEMPSCPEVYRLSTWRRILITSDAARRRCRRCRRRLTYASSCVCHTARTCSPSGRVYDVRQVVTRNFSSLPRLYRGDSRNSCCVMEHVGGRRGCAHTVGIYRKLRLTGDYLENEGTWSYSLVSPLTVKHRPYTETISWIQFTAECYPRPNVIGRPSLRLNAKHRIKLI